MPIFFKKPETITAAEVQSCLFVQIREIFYSSVIKKWPIETPSKGTVDQRNCRFGFFDNEDVAPLEVVVAKVCLMQLTRNERNFVDDFVTPRLVLESGSVFSDPL